MEEKVVMDREWTDKRMNDFADRVGRFEGDVKERFDQVDDRFDRFEGDVKVDFAKVDARFDKVDKRFDKVETSFEKLGAKMDWMNRVLASGLVTIVGAVIVKVFVG
jgi:DNA anti-recombination protein RmuC